MLESEDAAVAASRIAEAALRSEADQATRPEVRQLLADLADIVAARPTTHVIDFAAHGWTIMHPLIGCGMDLFDCLVNEAAERGVPRPARYARFRCDVDSAGRLVLGEEILPGDEPETAPRQCAAPAAGGGR